MLLNKPWIKCDCGFGDGWYHVEDDSGHEYNPFVSNKIATSKLYKDRRPVGVFFGHIKGTCVAAHINENGQSVVGKKFYYKKYNSRKETRRAAARWVVESVHNSLFVQVFRMQNQA